MKYALAAAAVLTVAIGSAWAQPAPAPATPPAEPAAATPPAAEPTELRLTADTMVRVELAEAVGSKDRIRGDKFAIRLSAPIVVDSRIVAPKGATGQGEVVYAEKGGGGGKPGKLVLAVRYIDVGPVRIKLKALRLGAGGDSEFTQMEVAAQLIGPAVMFLSGHEVLYPSGTRASAKVAEDVALPAGEPSPADPVVPAPASTAATPAAPGA